MTREENSSRSFAAGVVLFYFLFYIFGMVLERLVYFLRLPSLLLYPLSLGIFILLAITLFKKTKYLGLGFILSIPASALFIALLFFELWIHPPDEE